MNHFSLPRPDACQCTTGLGSSALLLLTSSANAAACHDITSMQQSIDATRNTSMGGHVTQYIYEMTSPSGSSQKDKTLFKSRGNYDVAWYQYGYIDNLVACNGNSKFQMVPLERLHMGKTDTYSYKQTNSQGVCTRWDTYMAKEISYGFMLKDGRWTLNTLYLVPLGQDVGRPRRPPHCKEPARPSGSEGQRTQAHARVAEAGATIFHATAKTPQEAIHPLRADAGVVPVAAAV